jgi:RNA polymerase sigma factor (sigma-70 family)
MVELINVARKDMSIGDWCRENNIHYTELNVAVKRDYSPITSRGEFTEMSIKIMDALGCIPEDLWDNTILYPLETNFCEFDSIDKDLLKFADEDFVSVCPSEYIEAEQFADRVQEVIEMMHTEKQKEVIRLRFGIDRDKEYTLKEVGVIFGVTSERIRQFEAKCLRILRHTSKSDFLLGLIDAFPIDDTKPVEKPITKPVEILGLIHVNPRREESYQRAKRFVEHALKKDMSLDSCPELKHLYYKL